MSSKYIDNNELRADIRFRDEAPMRAGQIARLGMTLKLDKA